MCAASALSAARTSSVDTPSKGAAAAATCSATDDVCALPDLRSCGADVIEIWRRRSLHSCDFTAARSRRRTRRRRHATQRAAAIATRPETMSTAQPRRLQRREPRAGTTLAAILGAVSSQPGRTNLPRATSKSPRASAIPTACSRSLACCASPPSSTTRAPSRCRAEAARRRAGGGRRRALGARRRLLGGGRRQRRRVGARAVGRRRPPLQQRRRARPRRRRPQGGDQDGRGREGAPHRR